ncbi:MAG: GNAT family N-acetyltransferase [Actinobacteria bacterium]|nr:GNAT family N-acetyltransferase [Actinomycetota bacterium]
MKVRRATPEDVPGLVHLFEELERLQREWRVFTPRPGFADEVARKYRGALDRPDVVVLVAEDDDQIVGMAHGEARAPSRFSDERALHLSGVVVRSDFRGRGVGRALVREASRFAAERGITWITLNTFSPNQGSMDFWESLGFRPRVVEMTCSTRALTDRFADEFG